MFAVLPVREFGLYVINNVRVRHYLVSVLRIVQLLPYSGIVEDEHGSLGGDVKFLGELHDDACYFAVELIVFHVIALELNGFLERKVLVDDELVADTNLMLKFLFDEFP